MIHITLYVIFVILIIYKGIRYVYSYWKGNNFPSLKPKIPYGNLQKVVTGKTNFGLCIADLYKQSSHKAKVIGIYLFFRPALLINDANIVKNILTTDFKHFHDRGIYINEKNDQFSVNLFSLKGEKWKNTRAMLTNTFSSGKIKVMFPTYLKLAERLEIYLTKKVNLSSACVVDVKNLLERFFLNITATVLFGIETDTINDEDNDFHKIASLFQQGGLFNQLRLAALFLCPKLLEITNTPSLNSDITDFLLKLVQTTIEHREKNLIIRKDFMHYLLQLRNSSVAVVDRDVENDDWNWNTAERRDKKLLSIEECASHLFLFYLAGYETSSSTTAYCLWELSRNPDKMSKLQKEIDCQLQTTNRQITYEGIQSMQYLDLCVKETMRLYPSALILNRQCTKKYDLDDMHLTIPVGTPIVVSLFGIHRDEKYFPNPTKFIPERFILNDFNANAYYPFGDGPRVCIAKRMGETMTKLAIVQLISKFNFASTDKKDLEFDCRGFTLISKNGIMLNVSKR